MRLGRPNAIVYGVVTGILAVAAQVFFGVTRPSAYGVCMACHGQEVADWTVNTFAGTHLQVGSLSRSFPLLTTVGVLLGAALASVRNREFRRQPGGGSRLVPLLLGGAIGVAALTALGCPTRIWLRVAYGEPLAVIGVGGLLAGIAAGTLLLRWRAG